MILILSMCHQMQEKADTLYLLLQSFQVSGTVPSSVLFCLLFYVFCFFNASSTLGKIFSRLHFDFFFLIFSSIQDLTFHAKCLKWRQCA